MRKVLPSSGSLSKCPRWLELGWAKAVSQEFIPGLQWVTGTQLLEPLSPPPRGLHHQKAEVRSRNNVSNSVTLIWDADTLTTILKCWILLCVLSDACSSQSFSQLYTSVLLLPLCYVFPYSLTPDSCHCRSWAR